MFSLLIFRALKASKRSKNGFKMAVLGFKKGKYHIAFKLKKRPYFLKIYSIKTYLILVLSFNFVEQ
jgi:hypothetical protein